ncbi:MAG: Gfo/Idh/MocA family oxidoreductase [Proteobacteria bacterium]|nr:Gfo/Idh/MocA family oxidoreductase [Pseudomonadota bacterium]
MLRAGVIGVGHLGRFHAQKYTSIDGVQLMGVYDLNSDRAKLVADECKTKAFDTIAELLKNVDIVSIATPATVHFESARQALEAGVHCLIEKPFTRTVDEANKLMDIAKCKNVKIQIGHLERFNTVISEGYSFIKNPRFIEANRLAPFTARSTDIDVILDLMIHDIDLILGIMKGSEVTEIDAIGVPVLTDKVDIAHAKLVFSNGAMANLSASRISNKVKMIPLEYPDALRKEIESFINAVKTNKEPVVTAMDAFNALVIAHKIIDKINKRMETI